MPPPNTRVPVMFRTGSSVPHSVLRHAPARHTQSRQQTDTPHNNKRFAFASITQSPHSGLRTKSGKRPVTDLCEGDADMRHSPAYRPAQHTWLIVGREGVSRTAFAIGPRCHRCEQPLRVDAPPTGWVTALAGLLARGSLPSPDLPGSPISRLSSGLLRTKARRLQLRGQPRITARRQRPCSLFPPRRDPGNQRVRNSMAPHGSSSSCSLHCEIDQFVCPPQSQLSAPPF